MPSIIWTRIFLSAICVHYAKGSEWFTSRGEHCIDRCHADNDGLPFYWCHTAHPDHWSLHSVLDYEEENQHPNGVPLQAVGRWDYCVPYSDSMLLESTDRYDNKSRPDFEDVNFGIPALAPLTECLGPCLFTDDGYSKCETDFNSTGMEEFFCSQEVPPYARFQLSATFGLWCLDPCHMGKRGAYICNTLYGYDFCSPEPGITYLGNECTSPCAPETTTKIANETLLPYVSFSCFIKEDNSSSQFCGLSNKEVSITESSMLEYTLDEGSICADPCKLSKDESFHWCKRLFWRLTNDSSQELILSWGVCGNGIEPVPVDEQHGFAGIVLGVILGTVALLVITSLVFSCYRKRKLHTHYSAARTREF